MGIIRCQLYKIKSGLNKVILAKGSSCSVTSGVMHKEGGGLTFKETLYLPIKAVTYHLYAFLVEYCTFASKISIWKFKFFHICDKKWPRTHEKCVLYLLSKYLQAIHILYGHYWIPHTQKHGHRHQNRDSSYARAQVIAKYVISMAAILNVS